MTRFIIPSLFALLLTSSCKKDKPEKDPPAPPTYEERLEGRWDLVSVKYAADFPNPQNPFETIAVNGEGSDVIGVFELEHNPNTLKYNYSFVANVSLGDTVPAIPVPVQRSGEGTWTTTSDESTILITEGEETYNLKVLVNENKRQVYSSTITQDVMGVLSVDVDVELEFSKP